MECKRDHELVSQICLSVHLLMKVWPVNEFKSGINSGSDNNIDELIADGADPWRRVPDGNR